MLRAMNIPQAIDASHQLPNDGFSGKQSASNPY
jgi:hypothetical protein